jgi:hypothetical protein
MALDANERHVSGVDSDLESDTKRRLLSFRKSVCSGDSSLCLQGLLAADYGWNLEKLVSESSLHSPQEVMTAMQMLAVEYDEDGINGRFHKVVGGTVVCIGSGPNSLGCESIDIGGVPTCSDLAVCIRRGSSERAPFTLCSLSSHDVVTLNGNRIFPEMGHVPLIQNDIVSVGGRVFTCILRQSN